MFLIVCRVCVHFSAVFSLKYFYTVSNVDDDFSAKVFFFPKTSSCSFSSKLVVPLSFTIALPSMICRAGVMLFFLSSVLSASSSSFVFAGFKNARSLTMATPLSTSPSTSSNEARRYCPRGESVVAGDGCNVGVCIAEGWKGTRGGVWAT